MSHSGLILDFIFTLTQNLHNPKCLQTLISLQKVRIFYFSKLLIKNLYIKFNIKKYNKNENFYYHVKECIRVSSTESTVHLSAANPNILLVQKIRDRPADESFGMTHSKIRRLPIVQISLFERLFQIRWACQKN